MANNLSSNGQSFWEHLDELRRYLFRIALVTIIAGIVAFFFKEELFAIILAPKNDNFVTYGVFHFLSSYVSFSNANIDSFQVELINTELAQQFIIHMKMAFYVGFLCVLPYVLYVLFKFVSPALYTHEKKYATQVVGSGYVMFMLGVCLSYFLIFPLTFRFLGTYQVNSEIENLISLQSYIETLMMLNLMMGIVFEIPILCWLFAKFGFLSASFMQHYRRHAIVILLIVAAIITPTADIFTLTLVSLPMYLLYEISIITIKRTEKRKAKNLKSIKTI